MNIAKFSIDRKTITLVLTAALTFGGIVSYQNMSRLEDPEFTIKDALVITPYAGATAREVEEEVTDEMEVAVQKMSQLDEIQSRSERGLSTLTVTMQDKYDKSSLPQIWDELRRKVNDAQKNLPPGAGPSIVVDDYGDVYGVFIVFYGKDYSQAELKKVTDMLRRELLLVEDVAKIDTFGERRECVYIELDRDRLAELGVPPAMIIRELQSKNLVSDAGRARVGAEFITLNPTGEYTSVDDFNGLLLNADDKQFYLRDVGRVTRGYVDPYDHAIFYDGQSSIALGISTISGGNVITMGEALEARLMELRSEIPLGIKVGVVSLQSEAVSIAIKGFVVSLLEAVAIVIVVLLFFMGARSGLLIGAVLAITILGSFLFLERMGVALERISLGALIIALGMLVDNAIVVVDGILVGLQKKKKAVDAAIDVVKQSAIPLLGATIIAIMAFAAIGTSQDSTGEFCRSLFQVIMVSLLLSWVTAVTLTPLLGTMFLKGPKAGSDGEDIEKDPYDTPFYHRYRGLLATCIRFRWITVAAVAGIFVAAVFGFGFVKQSFFPPSTRPQFMVDLWLPQGTHIDQTTARAMELQAGVREMEGVTHVSSLIGKGGLRFLLTYAPERANPSYAQLLVDVEDASHVDRLIPEIDAYIKKNFPDTLGYGYKFELGPGSKGKIQAQFIGPDSDVLRGLANQARDIMESHTNAKAVRTDWRQRTKVIRPVIIEEQANLMGIDRKDIAAAVRRAFQGEAIGVYREGDLLLPMIMRAPDGERDNIDSLRSIQIWSWSANRHIPITEVVSGFETSYEDEIIIRKDRKRTITTFCDPASGTASDLLAELMPEIDAIELPEGYVLHWAGEYEDSGKAQGSLMASIPVFIGMMILATICLFNNLRQPLVIWLCVPLALIGVSAGLLSTGQPFGFMALLGFLSLSGMLIKNAIVLIDEINVQQAAGAEPMEAILGSGTSRLRPVAMAASTTALGMLPLFFDAFFVSMAVTIVFGLVCATVLTMIVVPVFYAIIYRIK
ncbi:MAG: efflux RND transporter permease subunit [Akkermansiaceae bacterium]